MFKAITCEKPSKVPYAELKDENTETGYTYEESIYYHCLPGYRISGQLTSRCLANGKWSRVNGRCTSEFSL